MRLSWITTKERKSAQLAVKMAGALVMTDFTVLPGVNNSHRHTGTVCSCTHIVSAPARSVYESGSWINELISCHRTSAQKSWQDERHLGENDVEMYVIRIRRTFASHLNTPCEFRNLKANSHFLVSHSLACMWTYTNSWWLSQLVYYCQSEMTTKTLSLCRISAQ